MLSRLRFPAPGCCEQGHAHGHDLDHAGPGPHRRRRYQRRPCVSPPECSFPLAAIQIDIMASGNGMSLGFGDIGWADLLGCSQEGFPSPKASPSRSWSSEFTENDIVHRDLIDGLWVLLQCL